jgi:putative peptidoglycan lipid II flippase
MIAAMSLLRSAATIGFYTMLSRVLGFVRDVCIARFLGASAITDAFFVAFKLPNLMRRLFAEGAFNSAFVPLYAATMADEGKPAAQKLAGETLAVLLCVLMVLVALLIVFMPQVMLLLAPGFSSDPVKFEMTVSLTRITMPYILFISLVSLLGGILNSIGRFAAVAASPILLNIALITSILAWRDLFATPAHALAWGVVVAGILQLAWLVLFCMRHDILPPLSRPALSAQVKKLLALVAPAALGAGVAQVNLMVDMIIASGVPEGVSYLYYADRINQLPLGVIGVGVGTALLPLLARQMREKSRSNALHTQNRAIELVLLLALPAAAALLVIAQPIIATLYEHGQFASAATAATYPALMAYGAGLPAFVLIKVLAPGFYANHDTRTPFVIASFCVLLNLGLNLALVGPMAHVGLALATSVAGWANVALMAWVLHKRRLLVADATLRHRLPRMVLASGIMAMALAGGYAMSYTLFSEPLPYRALTLALLVALGLAVYAFAALLLRIINRQELIALLRRGGATKHAESPR